MASAGGAGAKKHGRNKKRESAKRYLAERRWVKNKFKKLEKYTSRNPNDLQAAGALQRLLK